MSPSPSSARGVAETPMMRQFFAAKAKHPEALLFFRMGDFYELFHDDAKVAAQVLGLTLTSRSKEADVPMAGVPVRSAESYLVRLVKAGHTVAICEQLEDPRKAKGLVERDVVRVVSPGTLTEESALDGALPLWVLAAAPTADGRVGLAWADVSTGAFRCRESDASRFEEELARIGPAEVLLPDVHESEGAAHAAVAALAAACARAEVPTARRQPWQFDAERGARTLREHFGVATLDAFGVADLDAALAACGGLMEFLRETQRHALSQVRDLRVDREQRALGLDPTTLRTLEVVANQRDGGREGTLLWAVDRTATPMGARLLREWLLEPLLDPDAIRERHDAVGRLVDDPALRRGLAGELDGLGDLERLGGRLAGGRAHPRDLAALAKALGRVPATRALLDEAASGGLGGGLPDRLAALRDALDPCEGLRERIVQTLVETPPLAWTEGGIVRDGFSAELDELRALARGGKEWLVELERREQERTGLAVKVGFNRVFGYYLEVSRAQLASAPDAVPVEWARRQSLKNAERFITPELKEYEQKVLGAEERARELEVAVFEELRTAAEAEVGRVLRTARALAELDVLQGLARLAAERDWVRPELLDPDDPPGGEGCGVLEVRDGRHPVVEQTLGAEPFVPNDTLLGPDRRLAVLTGPNMSGKSTYLRQTALVVLLAQAGSFVPASSARLHPVDRVFTRLGGGDDIARGRSTFMVEMLETAEILRHATARSLVLLDEVGRGTSTFDGLAIAWSVCEHLHDRTQARTLFATHYHQLTDLADALPSAVNLNVAVREHGHEIVFLHRIEEGGTDRSYGIHVAQLAGLPADVLARAREVLARLEREEEDLSRRVLAAPSASEPPPAPEPSQPTLFDLLEAEAPDLLTRLRTLDLDQTTPRAAWDLLAEVLRVLDAREEGR